MTAQLSLDGRPEDTARFSEDGRYRYRLTRELGGEKSLVSIGLNPSTATAAKNDQTITKEIGFAKRWGMGRLVKGNAYGIIQTKPKDMFFCRDRGEDIIGSENDQWLRGMCEHAVSVGGIILVCWGTNIEPERQRALSVMLEPYEPMCLGINTDKIGSPVHPLYQPYSTKLVPWTSR